MPRRAVLPSADEFFNKICISTPNRRPTWSAVGTVELARLLGVHMQSVYNWRCRGTGPEPEADPRRYYRRVGPRALYKVSAVLQWLDTEGRTAWDWTARSLVEIGATSLAEPERALRWIEYAEGARCFPAARWRWRSVERGLERLRQDFGF